jgi:hypothetical protein
MEEKWVVHCQAAGQGRQVLQYLARYIFRVAISNSRLEHVLPLILASPLAETSRS